MVNESLALPLYPPKSAVMALRRSKELCLLTSFLPHPVFAACGPHDGQQNLRRSFSHHFLLRRVPMSCTYDDQ